ncbi:Phage minor structural protein GP20 [Ruminococcaceae bacterium P7]|nr:Phage minor structural protein GP20 [Ruminococcaceae bacterium P7]
MEFLKEIFGGEPLTYEQLQEKLKEHPEIEVVNAAGGAYVPKSELDAVNTQLTEANTKAREDAEKYKDFEAQLQAAKDEGANALNAYKRDVAISQAISAANSADEVSVKANLNLEAVTFGEDGKLIGLEEQLTDLKTAKPFLFKEPEKLLDLGSSTSGVKGAGEVKGLEAAVADFYSEN